jgi:capsular polysaccharide biosynthesis protein
MELRFYFETLLRQKYVILSIVIAGLIGGYLYGTFLMPTQYNGSVFFTIAYRDDQQTEEYKIGNYWANQASIEFARTVSGWPENPRLVDEIYSTAGVNMQEDIGFLGKLLGPISVKRVERANLNLNFSSKTLENSGKIADAIVAVFETKLTEYNNEAAANYRIVGVGKAFEEKVPDPNVLAWVGAILGLIFGIIAAYMVEFFSGVITHPEQVEQIIQAQRFDAVPRSLKSKSLGFTSGYLKSNTFKHVLVAGVGINPNKFVHTLISNLEETGLEVDVVDGTHTGPGLHKYFKTKLIKGGKDSTPAQLKKSWKSVGPKTRLFSRLTSGPLSLETLTSVLEKKPVVISCELPLKTDVVDAVSCDELFLLVELGTTGKDLLKSVIHYLEGKPYKVIIIK